MPLRLIDDFIEVKIEGTKAEISPLTLSDLKKMEALMRAVQADVTEYDEQTKERMDEIIISHVKSIDLEGDLETIIKKKLAFGSYLALIGEILKQSTLPEPEQKN